MEVLCEKIDMVIAADELPWSRDGSVLEVELWEGGRRQKIELSRVGETYRFLSVVAGAALVTRSDQAWRDLARRAWRKNDLKEIVTFSFDRHDRLIGVIDQPADTLYREELVMYIEILARECDRFEYKLTGEDRE